MRIQEESPLPRDPLETLESDYEKAEVHLAWDRKKGVDGAPDERTLLFAFVELIPAEIPPPFDDYDPRDPRFFERIGDHHTLYVRHAVVGAKEALSWYLECRRGVAVLPGDDDGQFPAHDASGAKHLRIGDLGEEPAWPMLMCAPDDADTIPFAPEWMSCPRVHHLVPLANFNLDGLWEKKREQERAIGWLEDHLHFSLEEYPEYWGSVHLVAPNPVYRKLHAGRQRGAPPATAVSLRFEPRVGKRAEGLQLVYKDATMLGKLSAFSTTVHSRLVRMSFPQGHHSFQTDVIDPVRGMLENQNLVHVFIDGFRFDINVSGALKIKAPSLGSSYEVNRFSPTRDGMPIAIGGAATKVASAGSRLSEGKSQRSRRVAAEKSGQRWFRGELEEARSHLRGLIHGAKRDVLIVDPYFAHEELWIFMLAVGNEDVPIKLLSSAEVLKEPALHAREKGELLLDQVRRVSAAPRMNPFEVKVMIGGRPAVHDRFLLVDDRIWLLGSSLNEFGSRGTMMVSLPDPAPVRQELQKVWSEAMSLDKWVEEREKNTDKLRGKS